MGGFFFNALLVVTLFYHVGNLLQILLLLCCRLLWFTMKFVISYVKYIGKQLVMYIGSAINIVFFFSNNEYQLSEKN